jgi:hypothetical protein
VEDLVLPDGSIIVTTVLPSGNQKVEVLERYPDVPPAPLAREGAVQFYVPFTAVHPETVAGAPFDAVWVDVSSSPDAYFGALYGWWDRGEDFAILEHDVVSRLDVIEAFETCPEPWCVFGYDDMCHPACQEAWRNQLGCTRFRSELIAAVPDAVSSIGPGERDWHNLCDRLGERLRAAGYSHHWHYPPVGHHHMHRHDA